MHRDAIIKEACWAISNITAGTKEQVDAVIASGAVQELVRLLHEGSLDVKREALWAISNAASSSEPMQIAHLVQLGCLRPMVDLLSHLDTRIVMVALEGLKAVLIAGEEADSELLGYPVHPNSNAYALEIESVGGLDVLEELQNHASSEVEDRAVHILTRFFEVVPEEENVAPLVRARAGGVAFAPCLASERRCAFLLLAAIGLLFGRCHISRERLSARCCILPAFRSQWL